MASILVAAISTPAGNMAALQSALNAAAPGDYIRLTPGGLYDGTLTLPNKAAGAARITITSDSGATPAPGVQVAPADAATLPKFRVIVNNASAIKTCDPSAGVANGYILSCLELEANAFAGGDLITLGSNDSLLANKQDTVAKVPGFLTVDRCYLHGLPATGQKRGINLHCHDTDVRNCYISDIWSVGADSQAIGGCNGTGGYTVVNNYLEAAGENFLMGGDDPRIPGLVPAGLTFTRNLCYKPPAWRGTSRQVKNSIEFKNFRDWYVAGNRFFYCWKDGQVGYPVVLTPANQLGSNPATIVADGVFEYNWIAHAPGGVNLTSHDAAGKISARTANIKIRNNLFTDITPAWGDPALPLREFLIGNGSPVNAWEGVKDLVIEHNTFIASGLNANTYHYGLSSSAGYATCPGYVYRNNLSRHAFYGVFGDNGSDGVVTLNRYAPGFTWGQNVLAGGAVSVYPPGTFCPTVAAWQAQFVDYTGGDYTVSPSSPYYRAGTDGKDIGADLVGLAAAWAGTATPPPPPPPATYLVSPLAVNVAAAGVNGTLAVTTQPASVWSAVSGETWIVVTAGATGTGSGTVGYTVAANPDATVRAGTLVVAGSTITITQAALDPPVPVTPPPVITPEPPAVIVDPQVMLQWSDDGGHTWSDEVWVSAGKTGQYGLRAVWRRLGTTRERTFRVVVSDPIKVVLIDAFVEVQ